MAIRGDQLQTPTPTTVPPGSGLLAGLPMFRQPPPPDPPAAETTTTQPTTAQAPTEGPESDAGVAGLYAPGSHRHPSHGTRTRTSATGDSSSDDVGATPKPPSEKVTAEGIAAILALVVAAAAAAVRWRARARLRTPTDGQVDDVARPLARILLRHVPAAALNPDLVDAAIAGAGIGNYLKDGPLLQSDIVDQGVPHDLADPEREYR